ncbi:TetR/AcrR family transcriptional regulator [Pararhizobium haloflavum]|uniref:TetR/AcrR family transcriptional regulator n=1 Tax=Pararhizobium haloflavum TaxID=2037914 RepID=UPI000C197663|nr:TetR/AcrR family transcriptional regulator [Pararhizobium haloflavum]
MARTAGSSGAETATRLREAALGLFARSGYAAVSMRDIAEAVGLQPGALYNHVPTKQDLLAALMREHLEALIAAWQGEASASDDPAAALKRFVRFHIRYHLARPDAVFISYMELRNLDEANFVRIEALRRRYEAYLRDILDSGRHDGAFSIEESPIATMAIIAMLNGLTTWYRSGGRLAQETIEDIYIGMVARSVGLKEE